MDPNSGGHQAEWYGPPSLMAEVAVRQPVDSRLRAHFSCSQPGDQAGARNSVKAGSEPRGPGLGHCVTFPLRRERERVGRRRPASMTPTASLGRKGAERVFRK